MKWNFRLAGAVTLSGAALFLLLLLLFPPPLPAGETPLGAGDRVPPFEVQGIDEKARELRWPADEGAAFLFFFFDARTASGLYGMTVLDRFYRAAHDFGLEVLAVESSGRDKAEVSKSLDKYRALYPPPPFPVVVDTAAAVSSLFGTGPLPSIYLVGHHGVILDRRWSPGERDWGGLASRIKALLQLPENILADAVSPARSSRAVNGEGAAEPLPFPGDTVPPVTVTDLEGRGQSIPQFPSGEGLTILYLWSEPCRPCVRGLLFLDQVYRRAVDIGLELKVIAVGVDGLTASQAREAIGKIARVYSHPLFPFAVDEDSRLRRNFGRGTLPTTFFLDSSGKVVAVTEGFGDGQAAEWIGAIKKALPVLEGTLPEAP